MTDFESKLVAKTVENSFQKWSWTKIAEKRLQNAFQERQEAKKTPQVSAEAIKSASAESALLPTPLDNPPFASLQQLSSA